MRSHHLVLVIVAALVLVVYAAFQLAPAPEGPPPREPEPEEPVADFGESPEPPGVLPADPDEELPEPTADAAGALTVLVVDDGGVPLPGVSVSLSIRARGVPGRKSVTDNDGRCAFDGLPTNRRCTVRAEGSLYLIPVAETITPSKKGPSEVRLELVQGGAVSGFVVDEAGRLVEEAFTVTANHSISALQDPRRYDGHIGARNLSAEAGAFTLGGLSPGRYVARCRAKGYEGGTSAEFDVQKGVTTSGIRIVLSRGGSVSGVVVRLSTGEPVEGASVGLVPGDGSQIFMSSSGENRLGRGKRVKTDAQGRFEIGGVKPGTYTVVAVAKDLSPGRAKGVLVEKGRDAGGLLVSLGEGGGITGTVYGPDGKPVPGAEVLVSKIDTRVHIVGDIGRKVQADEKGVYFVDHLEPGDYRVKRPSGGGTTAVSMSVRIVSIGGEREERPARDPQAVVVREGQITRRDVFSQKMCAIRGKALYDDGKPVRTVVSLRSLSGEDAVAGGPTRVEIPRIARPNKAGEFTFGGLRPGEYVLQVEGQRRELTLTPGETENVEIRAQRIRVEGVVLDDRGRPVKGARALLARILEPGEERVSTFWMSRTAVTDEKGRFSFTNAVPGRYRVRVHSGAGGGESGEFTARPGETVKGIEVFLEATVGIRVQVLDGEGRPAKGVQVAFSKEQGGHSSRTSMTDDEGFAKASLVPGRYRILIRSGRKFLPAHPDEVVVGRSTGQTVTLRLE